MKKFTVCEITSLLGDPMNKNLEIISANSPEEALEIYKSHYPHIEKYKCNTRVSEYRWWGENFG